MRRLRSLSPSVVAFSAWLLASCGSDPTSVNGFTDLDGSGIGSGGMFGGGNGGSRLNAGGSNATSNGGTPASSTGGAGNLGNGGAPGDAGPLGNGGDLGGGGALGNGGAFGAGGALGNGGALGGNGGSPVRDASVDGPTPEAGPADASTDADAGCDQRFCAVYRSGIGCCLPEGRCGVDFGMGCVPIVPGQDGG